MITFKHKETGSTITLAEIKDKTENNYRFYNIVDGEISKNYYGKDIPFSNDFEIIVENNGIDFTEEELMFISLAMTNIGLFCTVREKELKRNILKKIDKKICL